MPQTLSFVYKKYAFPFYDTSIIDIKEMNLGMKKKLLTPCLLSLALCLTACGSAKKDDIVADFNEVQNVGTSSDAAEEMVEFVPDSCPDMQFDVSVDTNGANRAKLYSAASIEFNDDYLKSFAAKVFDDDTMEICKPYQICDKDELAAAIDEFDNINASAEKFKHIPLDYYNHIKETLDNYDENNAHAMEAGACIVEYATNYGSAYTGLMRGKINGTDYAMTYNDLNLDMNDDSSYETLLESGITAPIRLQRLTPAYDYRTTRNINYTAADAVYGENLVAENTAREQAEQFMHNIGLDDFVIENYGQRACFINDENNCYDGYTYMFTRQIEGVNCPIFECGDIVDISSVSHDGSDTVHHIAPIVGKEEYVRVDVDSDGIVRADFNNLYVMGDVISSDMNLISSNQATKIANQIQCSAEDFENSDSVKKVDVRFAYIPFTYDNKSVFLPAWIFYESKDSINAEYINTKNLVADNVLVAISALDGSEIAFSGIFLYSLMFQVL